MPYDIPDDPLQMDLAQLDLSFISNEETRRKAAEAIANLARIEQHLMLAHQAMEVVEKPLARIRAATPRVTIPPVTQLSWRNVIDESWLQQDMSEEAIQARFEEAWHAPV